MFPSEKRAPTPCLSPRFTPTPYCVLTVITPWPSLTLWPCPTRPQPIPSQYRYWRPLSQWSSTDLCIASQAFRIKTELCWFVFTGHYGCVSSGPAQGLHRNEELQQPQNSYTFPIQGEGRPKWHRGEAPAATRQTGVRSLMYCIKRKGVRWALILTSSFNGVRRESLISSYNHLYVVITICVSVAYWTLFLTARIWHILGVVWADIVFLQGNRNKGHINSLKNIKWSCNSSVTTTWRYVRVKAHI